MHFDINLHYLFDRLQTNLLSAKNSVIYHTAFVTALFDILDFVLE